MRQSRFAEAKIMGMIKAPKPEKPIVDVCEPKLVANALIRVCATL